MKNILSEMAAWSDEIIGYCRSGPAAVLYLRAVPATASRSRPGVWEIEFSSAVESEDIFPEDIVSIDIEHRSDRRFMESLQVECVPQPWASRIQFSLFNSGTTTLPMPSGWDGIGKFRGSAALAFQVSMIQRFAESTRAEILASGTSIGALELGKRVLGQSELFSSLSVLLAATGLSLAIIPAAHLAVNDPEPWTEFGLGSM